MNPSAISCSRFFFPTKDVMLLWLWLNTRFAIKDLLNAFFSLAFPCMILSLTK